jgi:hypothetical protein
MAGVRQDRRDSAKRELAVDRDATIQIGTLTVNIGSSWTLILGIAFIVVVIVFPQGVVGTWEHLKVRMARKSPRDLPDTVRQRRLQPMNGSGDSSDSD